MTECTSDGIRASGGTVTAVGEYTIHTFTSTGTFTVIDSTLTEVEVLVVGGGGSGGGPGNTPASGGGGGGGVLTASRSIDVQSYIVTVGDGAGTYDDGGYSAFDDMVVFGGKGIVSGYDGGASGYCTLGSWLCNGVDYGDASGNLEAQRAGGVGSSDYCGGGAGAGGVGQDATIPNGGKGGDGILSSISGTATYYGGGGGGGSSGSSGGSGGLGGGGNGADGPAVWPKSGEPNTGGGGGGNGGSSSFFAEGGSGIVIVRYKAAASSEQSCGTGGSVTTDGDYTIHTFTSTGTFEVTDSTLADVEVLVVGGGGGGGQDRGGGGGGGAVLYSASRTLSSNSITVTVGGGGAGGDYEGEDSVFDVMVANGGGYGEFQGEGGASGSGESGGGGRGGGGGGAGGAGGAPPDGSQGGDGGPGIVSTISGTSNYYGGGGGGW